jgi:hypothetical protein
MASGVLAGFDQAEAVAEGIGHESGLWVSWH